MNVQRDTAFMALNEEERFSNLEKLQPAHTSSPPKTYRRLIVFLSIGITAILTSFILYRIVAVPKTVEQCGTTAAEARSKGCVFEMTGFSWLPKECADPMVEMEFLNARDLQYYRDSNYTQEVPLDEVRKGDGPGFYVKQDYHLAHCGFLFKKLHRAISEGKKVDGVISPVGHTGHCVQPTHSRRPRGRDAAWTSTG